jgi:hypothetical protein
MEEPMKKPTLADLEKRVAELEARIAKLEPLASNGIVWKDWRLAVGKIKRTEIQEAIDEEGRKYREADRRKTAL